MVPASNNNTNVSNYNNRRSDNWLPSFFNEFFNDDFNWLGRTNKSTPAINVVESDKDYKVEVAVPGVKKEDCKIRLNDDIMTISVEKEQKPDEENAKHYLRQEFSYSKFEQSFTLPEDVNQKEIRAEVKDGVLNISLPKQEPKKEEDKWQNVEIQ